MTKKEECQGCIGFTDEHTCEGHAEFLAIRAAKDKCHNCERLTTEVARKDDVISHLDTELERALAECSELKAIVQYLVEEDDHHYFGETLMERMKTAVSGSHERRTQKKVLDWAVRSFGNIAKNRDERAARLAEEAIEVAQAEGVPEAIVSKILARVYSRPIGELSREIGGVGITLEALAENAGHDLEADTEREWRRVLSKSKDWWTKKHAAKVAAGTANISPACDDSSQECEHPPESITGPPDAMFCRLCSKYVTHDDFPADPVDSGRCHHGAPLGTFCAICPEGTAIVESGQEKGNVD